MTIYEVNISPDLKAKYLKEGYESCLREVKARVGSVGYIGQENDRAIGWDDCLDEIKKLINEI